MQIPLKLRVFWLAFFVGAVIVASAPFSGPAIEDRLAPVREPSAIENIGRGSAYLWFDWVGRKGRTPASPGADVTMDAAGDDFDLALYNDISLNGEPRCTRVAPWSRLLLLPAGFHRQRFCIEIPRAVASADPITVNITLRYQGFLGLWETRTRFPTIVTR